MNARVNKKHHLLHLIEHLIGIDGLMIENVSLEVMDCR